MPPALSLLLLTLTLQSPAADSLRLLARYLPDSALVRETRARPLEVRDALGEMLVRAVKGPAAARDSELSAAHRHPPVQQPQAPGSGDRPPRANIS